MAEEAFSVLAPQAGARQESYRAGTLVVLLRLHWFIRLRWLFVALALGELAVERFVLPAAHRPAPLLLSVLGVAAVNVVWTVISRLLLRRFSAAGDAEPVPIRDAEVLANAQVAVDLLLLTLILHYTGGAENPMSVFYLFHVAISALLLETWQAGLQSCWAVLLYACLTIGEWRGWLLHFPLLPHLGPLGLHQRTEWVFLMIGVDVLAVLGTLYFTIRITKLLDDHEARLKQANAALEQSQRAIEDLQRRRARFMQMAAHQLKSPLAIVQTLANLIRDRVVTDECGILSTCEKIARRAQDGIAQVGELLTLARVQDADAVRRRGPVEVYGAIAELCRRFRPLAEQKGIELTLWTPSDGEVQISVDPQDFQDCIGNLLDNALKYTPGPGRVRIAATKKTSPNQVSTVSVHVSDTGMGLDPALMRSGGKVLGDVPIFEAFRRGSNVIAASIPGSGLGLSIVREVVERAGGHIWVMSRTGAGTSFTVTFPVAGSAGDQPLVRDTRATEVVLSLSPGETAGSEAFPHGSNVAPGDRQT